ncbi:MAG: efflux RND transporter periplasmic adaptor subunit [Chloroflexi bacterium]|nr:efflux RND transporter periplasmic adaptor subunit [Chloroflexota bacterium]
MSRSKRKSRRFFWLIAIVLAMLAIASGIYFYQANVILATAKAAAANTVKTARVKKGDITITATGTATLVPVTQVGLAFRSGGQIVELRAQAGDAIKTGQTLAKLDTTQLDLQLAQAEANLALAQSKLSQVQKGGTISAITAAQANLNSANAAYDKLLHPDPNDVTMAKSDVEMAKAAVDQAQAAYDKIGGTSNPSISMTSQSLQLQNATLAYQKAVAAYNTKLTPTDAQLKAAQAQIQQAKDALARLSPTDDDIAQQQANVDAARAARDLAEQRLIEAVLIAPFGGTITDVKAAVGQVVGTTSIMTLMDVSKAWVQIAIDETDSSKAALSYPVDVTFDALPDQTFSGSIVQVSPSVVMVNGVSTLYVVAELKDPSPSLRVGMNGSAKVTAAVAKQVLTIPVEAVRQMGANQYAVFVVDAKQQLTLRPVEIGLKGTSLVEIKSGLQVGETVSTGTVATQ